MTQSEQPRAADLANSAADTIRSLNHCTHPGNDWPGLEYPSDVYCTLAALARLADRLPQTLRQVAAYLLHELQLERIAFEDGDHASDPTGAVAATARLLNGQACHASRQLAAVLDAAQQTIAFASCVEAAGEYPP